jgi:hypothetical protein
MEKEHFTIQPKTNEPDSIECILHSEISVHKSLANLKEALCNSLEKKQAISIRSEEQINADIAFVQLMYALKKQAQEQQTPLSLDLHFNETSEHLFEISDLLHIIKTK